MANQGEVYDRVDAVVRLSAPVEVIFDRVADRANPFGSMAEDRTKIANDRAAFEPLPRAGANREIVTTAPVAEVVVALEQVASGAGHRDPLRSRRAHRTRLAWSRGIARKPGSTGVWGTRYGPSMLWSRSWWRFCAIVRRGDGVSVGGFCRHGAGGGVEGADAWVLATVAPDQPER